ncbi:MAG TPA: DUF559 domain-containing protein [Microbacterium sp.]|nr:DUF559 domain-containing protein [Microbacterium sp.]
MGKKQPLPADLGSAFDVAHAKRWGVGAGRLRGGDLARPFHGVRIRADAAAAGGPATSDPYEQQRHSRVIRAREYAPRLHPGHCFSHQTAASAWGAPLPLERDADGRPLDSAHLELHICAVAPAPQPRAAGVTGHRSLASLTTVREHEGLRLSSPASTWASLGILPLADLIALGDYFCRQWREGRGRPSPGRLPLATIDELAAAVDAGRRRGAGRLRKALPLIREDSWSPRESLVRFILVSAGLPEPELNVDLSDQRGRFLGCVDMVYRTERVVIEYLGMLHGESWARDVERIAALRAAGWTVIEVTSTLVRNPAELVRRVGRALGC